MAEGSVTVHAYTSRAMIPVAGATVSFTQFSPDGSVVLLSVRTTDESGRTDPVVVPTPEKSESLAPAPDRPYALNNIDASHPGYERIVVEHVQIFPGVRTLQPLEMIPLEEYPSSSNQTEVFDLPTQNL